MEHDAVCGWKDRILLTPGPLTTSQTVKLAMLKDCGSREEEMIHTIRFIRKSILRLGNADKSQFTTILMQGSGTFGIEATLSTVLSRKDKLLILLNGSYGQRIKQIANIQKIPYIVLEQKEHETIDPNKVDQLLTKNPHITHVALVHCETTTGILNPITPISTVVKKHSKQFIVDAMSSFGAVPIDVAQEQIDYLISSSNKCLEGVPGFSFIIANKEHFINCEGQATTLSLDLHHQWLGLEKNGQFRFTPPTHALLAFKQALIELDQEGGIAGRKKRYQKNHQLLLEGMTKLNFKPYLTKDLQGWIITTFHNPTAPWFSFNEFYQELYNRGQVIYPGKLTHEDCFRVGNIGRIFAVDILNFLIIVKEITRNMQLNQDNPLNS